MATKITPIGQIVKDVFAQMESKKTVSRDEVDAYWKKLVGDAGAKHTRPITLRKGVLNVLVDSSVWMQEVNMRKRGLLKGLKSMFGKDKISQIQFKIGEF
jgi:predicted nucleic acid-binding Zn ribbon protein